MTRIAQVRFVMSGSKHQHIKAKATVICTRGKMVLLVRKQGAKWKFPSGLLATGEAPMVAAAREIWKELSLHCSALNAVGTIDVGSVLHHIYTTDLTDGCNIALGSGIVACRWVGWEDLSSTMLKPTAAALLAQDLSELVHHVEPQASVSASTQTERRDKHAGRIVNCHEKGS